MTENENTTLCNAPDCSPTREDAREDLMQKAIFTFISTDKLHRRAIERWATDAGMHRSQHRMLMHLSCCHTIPSQKDLALHFDISPAAVAGTLKRLESDGYIERGKCSCHSDSRCNEIRITERGREATMQSRKYFRHIDVTALRGFTDEELDIFIGFLERMQVNLRSCDSIPPENERKDEQ